MNAAEDTLPAVDKNEKIEPGALYEIVVEVKGKYDVKNVNKVIRLIRFGEGIVDKSPFTKMTGYWTIEDIVAESDKWNNVVPYDNTGPSENYRLRIRARKTATGTPVFVAVGIILALVIILVGVVGWNAYRIKDLADDPIWTTAIVGAVVIAALIYARSG